MAPKAPDAFRTISEVADWLGVSTHVLRFWESKFPQIKPVKRAGGRRYYRPADMELLGGLRKLLHDDGLTVKGAQKLLKEQGVKAVSALSPPVDLAPAKQARPVRIKSAATTANEPAAEAAAPSEPVKTADTESAPGSVPEPEMQAPTYESDVEPAIGENTGQPFAVDPAPDTPTGSAAVDTAEPEAESGSEMDTGPESPVDHEPESPLAEESDETPVSPIFSAPSASEKAKPTQSADKAPEQEGLPLFSRRRLPESLTPDQPGSELEAASEPDEHAVEQAASPETDSDEAPQAEGEVAGDGAFEPDPEFKDAAPEGPEPDSEHETPADGSLAPVPSDLRIAPLPGPDLTLAESLERLAPGQIPASRLAPIHARMIALRDRMETGQLSR